MSKKIILSLLFGSAIVLIVFMATSYSKNEPIKKSSLKTRWYTQSQVKIGKKVFQNNCVSCHGDNAQGAFNWKKPINGSYPPPPLNGTAHTWHHPMKTLKNTIKNGGIPSGGKMPPFNNILSNDEIDAVIAFFQDKWESKIYNIWAKRNGLR